MESKCKLRPTLIPSIDCEVAQEVFWRVEAEIGERPVATVCVPEAHPLGYPGLW